MYANNFDWCKFYDYGAIWKLLFGTCLLSTTEYTTHYLYLAAVIMFVVESITLTEPFGGHRAASGREAGPFQGSYSLEVLKSTESKSKYVSNIHRRKQDTSNELFNTNSKKNDEE